jgi:hypothetical protein
MKQEGNLRAVPRELFRGVPVRPRIGDPRKGGRASGMVVVRLVPEAGTAGTDKSAESLSGHAEQYGLRNLTRVLDEFGSPRSQPLVHSVPGEQLLEMERAASQTKFPPLHSLTQYWRIDFREHSRDEVARLLQLLNALPEVDAAYEEPLSTLPVVTAADDPYNVTQDYQDAAPLGIDARWMWTQPDGEGAGVGIMDVEGGWRVTHEDLAGKAPTLIHGAQYASWEDHGTAVLGEIVAIDNTVGVVGAAPAINNIRMSSIYDAMGVQHVTDALAAAVAAMTVGQIMLIELQVNYLPEETLDDRLDVIRLASARGITVVEAAGNGNSDLDAWTTPGGLHRLDRTSPDFVDSGAIMVGASVSTVPHNRWWASNFGSRIDCFAWGENVTSTGYGDLDNGGGNADRWYTDTFQGTSSASPIIVAAAALVQSNYQAAAGTVLSPMQLRAILANPATGTAQGGGVAGELAHRGVEFDGEGAERTGSSLVQRQPVPGRDVPVERLAGVGEVGEELVDHGLARAGSHHVKHQRAERSAHRAGLPRWLHQLRIGGGVEDDQPADPLRRLVGDLEDPWAAEVVADEGGTGQAQVIEQGDQAAGLAFHPVLAVVARLVGGSEAEQVGGDGPDTGEGQLVRDTTVEPGRGGHSVDQHDRGAVSWALVEVGDPSAGGFQMPQAGAVIGQPEGVCHSCIQF